MIIGPGDNGSVKGFVNAVGVGTNNTRPQVQTMQQQMQFR